MGVRGRQSGAALAIVSSVTSIARPEPPSELNDEQAEEWRAVVGRMPADWFGRETHGMLAQYCRRVVTSRRVAELIQKAEEADTFDLKEYDLLLKMQDRESGAISSLATRMRISQHSNYDKKKSRASSTGKRPWEDV